MEQSKAIKKVWHKSEIVELLNNTPRAVEKAMLALYERQTMDEKASATTNHHNRQGFSGWTARSGTYYARYVNHGGMLTGKHLEKARKIAIHHAIQLTNIANKKL